MREFGLIGYPLSHSFSKKYFTQKFSHEGIDAVYENYPLKDIAGLASVIEEHPLLEGINVTIPHKQSVISYLHKMSAVVEETGACNCIRIKNKTLEGFNTDVIGFEASLSAHLTPLHSKAIVLGSGGAAKAVCYVLGKKGIPFIQASRSPTGELLAYKDLSPDIIREHRLIINTTPLGMFPDTEACPDLPYDAIGESHYLFDLVYNPSITLFLLKGREQGAIIENGYRMLELQAEESWKIWNNR
jgi:shikimate dehydrogenase